MTPKQEAFVRKYVETGCASTAYRGVYNATNMNANAVGVEAHRVLKNPKVSLKVAELQAGHQKRHEITVDKLTDMAMNAYKLAMKESVEAPSAAVSAVTVLGKLHGLIVDKSKNEHVGKDGEPLVPSVHVTISRPKS